MHQKSSSTNVHIAGKVLLRDLFMLLCLWFCVSSDQGKKDSVAKTL